MPEGSWPLGWVYLNVYANAAVLPFLWIRSTQGITKWPSAKPFLKSSCSIRTRFLYQCENGTVKCCTRELC